MYSNVSAQTRRDSVYVPPPKQSAELPKPRIEVRRINSDGAGGRPKGRRGVISARAQRIASAARERTPARGSSTDEISMSSAAPMNPIADYLLSLGAARPTTAGPGGRSGRPPTAGGGRSPMANHRSAPGSMSSSMDSVTFESELTRVGSDRRTSPRTPGSLAVPGTQETAFGGSRSPMRGRSPGRNERAVSPAPAARAVHPVKTTTVVFAAPPTQQQSNTDDEYEEEKDEVMRQMSGVNSQIDKERERQKAMLRDRQEKKKVKHVEHELLASEMVREASLLGEQKRKEKERQEHLIKERLEERKKRKNEITVVVDVEGNHRSTNSSSNGGGGSATVVQVSESDYQADTTKIPTTKNGRKITKTDSGLGGELSEIIEIETQ